MWIPCPHCCEYWCLLHGKHAHDCDCPPVEEWLVSPYLKAPMPKAPDTFATRLNAARVQSGLSVITLASKAGIHPDYVYRLERGAREPSLAVARALARALAVPLAQLAGK